MYTIEQYSRDTLLLTSGLVIKHHDIAIIMNDGVLRNGGTVDKTRYDTWKYYLNLQGIRHETDNLRPPVKVNMIEGIVEYPIGDPKTASNTHELTLGLLAAYPGTKAELDTRLDMYQSLINDYPDDTVYINACLTPVQDINAAYNAPDGAIVAYSTAYIEPQEFSLVRELSTAIQNFFSRWYIKEYNITDELYMSSVMGVLYATIPSMIASIRMTSSSTAEAHSFHLEHFFRSHLDLWNLVNLINNVGSQSTLDSIVNKILIPNNIGVGNIVLNNTEAVVNTTPKVHDPRYTRGPVVGTSAILSDGYTTNTPIKNIGDLSVMSLRSYNDTVTKNAYGNNAIATRLGQAITDNVIITQNTKILDFGDISVFKEYNKDPVSVILDIWLEAASSGMYTDNADFLDPNTKILYRIDPFTGLLMFYSLLHTKLGIPEPSLLTLTADNVPVANISSIILKDMALSTTGIDYVISTMLNELTGISKELAFRPKALTGLTGRVDAYIRYHIKAHDLSSNMDNAFISADIANIANAMFTTKTVSIPNITTPTALSVILAGRGVTLDTQGLYDPLSAMSELFLLFTGVSLDETLLVKGMFDSFRTLMAKLTGYTTQIVPANISSGELSAPYSTIAPIKADTGYMVVTDANIVKALEDFPSPSNIPLLGAGDNFIDQLIPTSLNVPVITTTMGNFSIAARVGDVSGVSLLRPAVDAEVLSGTYDIFAPGYATVYGSSDRAALTNAIHMMTPSARGDTSTGAALYGVSDGTTPQQATIGTGTTIADVVNSNYDSFAPNGNLTTGNNVNTNTNTTIVAGPPSVNATVTNGLQVQGKNGTPTTSQATATAGVTNVTVIGNV